MILVLLAVPTPRVALARDTWSTPYTGMRLLYRTTGTPNRIHALVIDLCARGVSLRATREAERWRTTSSFGRSVNAEAAVNGDFFSWETHRPNGLAIGNGVVWHADARGEGYVVFGHGRAEIVAPGSLLADPPAWMREAVSGKPLLVEGGTPIHEYSAEVCRPRHPRTAVGLSQDRQTLYLVVVDGRSNVSAGMTCRELADLLAGLGAHTALNLDGGGSTTMWVRGEGVVNDPSDGSERTVANHLAVQATGSGPPGSCDWSFDEVLLQASVLDRGSSDLDGDGRADVCARAAAGLLCHPSTGAGFGARWTLPELSNAQGWDDETNYSTLRLGDLDGDGRSDVCARGDARVFCWPSTGAGFGPRIDGPQLSDESGWDHPRFFSTLRLADFDGDGRDDLCARAAAGLRCWPSTGRGFGTRVQLDALSDAAGWNVPDRYGTLRMGDVDGDGRADVCGRASAGMRCWLSDGQGFPEQIDGPALSDAAGWGRVEYWSTIRLVDLDGDGRADLCAREADRLRCWLSTGRGFGPAIDGPALADASGWSDHGNYATLRFGDVDGDGGLDVCARANARVYCWLWRGAGFPLRIDGPTLSDDAGWGDHRYYSSLRLGDVTGDGKADLCARGVHGVFCWPSTGDGFGEQLAGPAWTDENGWDNLRYYTTLRLAGPRCTIERCNGRDDDCDGEVDEGCTLPGEDAGLPGEDAGAPGPDGGPVDLGGGSEGPDAGEGEGAEGAAEEEGEGEGESPEHEGKPLGGDRDLGPGGEWMEGDPSASGTRQDSITGSGIGGCACSTGTAGSPGALPWLLLLPAR